jgi:DNA-binding IclR family transcriptional regulator
MDVVAASGASGAQLKDIALESGLNTATCHRVLTSLVSHGLLSRDAARRYVLGNKLMVLGARASHGPGLRGLCAPTLDRLRQHSGETAVLMLRNAGMSVCVDRREGDIAFRTLTGSIGGAVPLGVGPGSLAMLAFLPAEEVATLIQANAARYAEFERLSPAKVLNLVNETQRQGFALDMGELIDGVGGMAIPVRSPAGSPVASLGLTFLATPANAARLPSFEALLRAEASSIEAQLSPFDLPSDNGLPR